MGKLVDSLVIIGSLWTKWVLIVSPPPCVPAPGCRCQCQLLRGSQAGGICSEDCSQSDHCSIQITAGPAHTELSLQYRIGR